MRPMWFSENKPIVQSRRFRGRMKRVYFTDEQIIDALRTAGGVQIKAAQLLAKRHGRPCSRTQINSRINRSKKLIRALEDIREEVLDFAEGKLLEFINAGSEKSVHYYLSTIGKHRGYTRRIESTGPAGGPIEHSIRRPIEDMTVEEAEEYLAARAAGPESR